MRLLFELSWMNFCWQIWWIFKDRGWLSRRSSLRPGSLLSFAHWHLALAKGSQIPTSLLAKAKSLQNHHMLWKFNDVICWIVNIRDTVIPIRTYQLYPMLGRRSRLAAVTSSCFTWLISSYGSTSVHFNGLVRSAVPAVPCRYRCHAASLLFHVAWLKTIASLHYHVSGLRLSHVFGCVHRRCEWPSAQEDHSHHPVIPVCLLQPRRYLAGLHRRLIRLAWCVFYCFLFDLVFRLKNI